jgi:L-arabinose isomerase
MKEFANLRVGLFGIGLAAYWEQFPGLEERLKASVRVVEEQLRAPGREIVNLGLIDSPERALTAACPLCHNLFALCDSPPACSPREGSGPRS